MIAATLARWCQIGVRESVSQWARIPLPHQLAGIASALLLSAMALIATSVSGNISDALVNRYAVEVALFTDSFVAPRVQELAAQATLSEGKKKELDGLFLPVVMGRPILTFRIWVTIRSSTATAAR